MLRLCHPDKLSFKTRVPDKFLIPGIFRTHSSGTSPSCSSLQRKKIIVISWRLLIKVECQGIVILLAQHRISLTVVTGGGAERRKLRKSHYICGKWSLCNASIARLVFDAIKIRMTTRSICLVSRTVFSYRRYVRFKQMLVHHVFHFLRHEQEQPGMKKV